MRCSKNCHAVVAIFSIGCVMVLSGGSKYFMCNCGMLSIFAIQED